MAASEANAVEVGFELGLMSSSMTSRGFFVESGPDRRLEARRL